MRSAVKILILLALLPAIAVGSSAFNRAALEPRSIVTAIVDDDVAYLKLAGYGRHACFVSMLSNGSAEIHFDNPTTGCYAIGDGQGVNAGSGSRYSRYAFHDVLSITNAGGKDIFVWVNVTTSSASGSAVEVAKKDTPASMADSDYYASTSATALTIPVGDAGYVGARVKGGTLTAGNDVTGWVTIVARRNG